MAEHYASYFHAQPESKKDCAYPGVFRCQKNQYPTQHEQRDGQDTFAARILDHGKLYERHTYSHYRPEPAKNQQISSCQPNHYPNWLG